MDEAEKYAWIFIIVYSYARGVGSEHFSTSAKTGAGVIDIFSTLARSKNIQPIKTNL